MSILGHRCRHCGGATLSLETETCFVCDRVGQPGTPRRDRFEGAYDILKRRVLYGEGIEPVPWPQESGWSPEDDEAFEEWLAE